jgi:hypothetical protein
MAPNLTVEVVDDHIVVAQAPEADRPRRNRRRLWKVLIGIAVVLVVLVVAAVLWFFLGREQARQIDDGTALEQFQEQQPDGSSTDAAGRPGAGVYSATADGTESIGVPGLDEGLGPNAPVTVTHGEGGCFTYRADFNSHHWRDWTYCPTADATFALTGLQSWTARKAPGFDLDSLASYTCETPIGYLWPDSAAGDRREGSCTGTASDSDGVTADAQTVEVLERTTLLVAGEVRDVVHLRSTDTLTEAQDGTEVDEWWIDATTGLPLKVMIDARITISGSDYRETATLQLSSLTPAT